MCTILKMADRRAKTTKFGTRGPRYYVCRVRYMSDSLSSVWGRSVHIATFLMLRFSKRYSYSFDPI